MKLIHFLYSVFALNLLQCTGTSQDKVQEDVPLIERTIGIQYFKGFDPDRGSTAFELRREMHPYKLGDYIGQFLNPMRVIYRLVDATTQELLITDINSFIDILKAQQTPSESLSETAKRICNGLKLDYTGRRVNLIFQNRCVRPEMLEILADIRQDGHFNQQRAEILGNSTIAESNPKELSSYKLQFSLKANSSLLQETDLATLVNMIRDPSARREIVTVTADETEKFSNLRYQYGLKGEIKCGPLLELCKGSDLHNIFDELSHLYIMEHKNPGVKRYLCIRPAGESIGVGIVPTYSFGARGSTVLINVNLVPVTVESKLLMPNMSNDDKECFFKAMLASFKNEHVQQFCCEHKTHPHAILRDKSIQMMLINDGGTGEVHGGSVGVSMFVAICSAITGKPINPNVAFSGGMDEDGTVGEVAGTPAKAKVLIDLGYRRFGIPIGSVHNEFGKEKFADPGKFPQLEPGEGLVRKVKDHDFEIHLIRNIPDVLKLAFGFEVNKYEIENESESESENENENENESADDL